uniref:Uncharacterized protein n=1 Tax=Anguilla anguilla TaxID=7936 RepID=A0A0E9X722_ANGAN
MPRNVDRTFLKFACQQHRSLTDSHSHYGFGIQGLAPITNIFKAYYHCSLKMSCILLHYHAICPDLKL